MKGSQVITSDHKIVVINRETHVEQNANSEARDYWGPLLKLFSVFTAANGWIATFSSFF